MLAPSRHPPSIRLGPHIVATVFVAGIFLVGLLFSIRAVFRPLIPPQTSPSWARRFLHGGASEIAGSRPPDSGWRGLVQWEFTENHFFKVFFLELANGYDGVIGWNVPLLSSAGSAFVVDGLFLGRSRYVTKPAREQLIRMVTGAMEVIRNQGIPVVYVAPPSRFTENDSRFDGVFNFENDLQDQILTNLTTCGLDYLDTRKCMASDALDSHQAFFATDHHSTPETGIWIAQTIAQYLQAEFRLPLDVAALDKRHFCFVRHPASFLGSMGRQVTLARCAPDDFSVMDTRESVDLELNIPARNLHARGPFNNLLWTERLQMHDLYRNSPYTAYLWSDNPIISIRNHACTNGVRLLLLSDSIDNVVAPPLALAASEVVTIDFRYHPIHLMDYLEQYRFDAVLLFWHFPEASYQNRFTHPG